MLGHGKDWGEKGNRKGNISVVEVWDWVAREGLIEKMLFEWRPEGNDGISRWYLEKVF